MSTLASKLAGAAGADIVVPGWPRDRPAYESLAAAVQGEGSRWNVPGLAVGILRDGAIETTSAGFANLATRIPMTDDTISQIGSISKVFTATLAMILVEEGLLDLDTSVVTWLPNLELADKSARDAITLRHLLSHTSGLEGDRFIDYGRGADALANAVAEFGTLRQWFVPGDLWSYSNAGYYLACRVIEVVAGQPFEDVFQERLIASMGLEPVYFFAEDVIAHSHAVGHYLKRREVGHATAQGYSMPRHINGTGGVVTSTIGLLRFAQFHLADGKVGRQRLLAAKATRAMRKPIAEAGDFHRHYGLGWCVHEYPEFHTISHGGATRGFRANLTVVPDAGFAIASVANGDAGTRAIREIEEWALKTYLDVERPVPARMPMSAKKLGAFAGTYRRHDGEFTVTAADSHLDIRVVSLDEETGEVEDDQTHPVVPVGDRRFRLPDGPQEGMIVDFISYDGYGRNQEFLRVGGRLAERVEDTGSLKSGKVGKRKKKS